MFPSKKVCQVERGKQLVVEVVVPARSKLFSPLLYHVVVSGRGLRDDLPRCQLPYHSASPSRRLAPSFPRKPHSSAALDLLGFVISRFIAAQIRTPQSVRLVVPSSFRCVGILSLCTCHCRLSSPSLLSPAKGVRSRR